MFSSNQLPERVEKKIDLYIVNYDKPKMFQFLPQDIIRHIFLFDSTYREVFRNEVMSDIHISAWKCWKKRLMEKVNRGSDTSEAKRFDCLLTYYIDHIKSSPRFDRYFHDDVCIISSYRTTNTSIISHSGILFADIYLFTSSFKMYGWNGYVRSGDEEMTYRNHEEFYNNRILPHSLVHKDIPYSVYRVGIENLE